MKSATLGSEESSPDDAKEPDTKAPVDAAFLHFQERLHNEPDQVLRLVSRVLLVVAVRPAELRSRRDPLLQILLPGRSEESAASVGVRRAQGE